MILFPLFFRIWVEVLAIQFTIHLTYPPESDLNGRKYGVILQLFKIKKTTDILTNVCGSLMILSE